MSYGDSPIAVSLVPNRVWSVAKLVYIISGPLGWGVKSPNKPKLLDDVQARQRNTVWPDTLRNGRTLDGFLWKGSPDATLVQRVGVAIFGLFFLATSFLFVYIALSEGGSGASLIIVLFALFWLVIGCKLLGNAFRH
jgi:hypothetical protein